MKYTLLFLFCLNCTWQLSAQSNQHKIAKNTGQLIINGLDEVVIEGYSGNEIIVTTDDFDDEENDRAKGLKLVNSLGLEDNSGIGLNVKEDGVDVVVTQISSSCDATFKIKLPYGMGVDYEHRSNSGGDITISDVSKEIIISTTYGDIGIYDVTGPMAVKTVYGYIEAKFSEVSQSGSISLESVYDFVDVSLPTSSKADITMRTPYGEIYSNIDIDVEENEGLRKVSNTFIEGSINGGGVDLNLRASYENIYLRKK